MIRSGRGGWLATLSLIVAVGFPPAASAQEKLAITQYGKVISSLPWAVALEKGWLGENGLHVESILSSDGGGTSVRNMMASDLPFGEVAFSAAVAARFKAGLDVEVVYGAADSPGEMSWVALPDSGIKTIADLPGKIVGYTSPQSATEMLLRLALDKSQIAASSVKLLPVGGVAATLTALNGHGIDVGVMSDPLLALNEDKIHIVFAAPDLFPRYMWSVGLTTKAFARQHPDQIRALIAARRKAVQFIAEQPEASIAIYGKVWELDAPTARTMFNRAKRYAYWSEGDFDAEGLATMVKGMSLAGVIDQPLDLDSIIDQDYLPADLRRKL